jgi:Rho-binding antiterminator
VNGPEYVPLPCDVHDELEAFAVRREAVRIRFRDPQGADREITGTIVDIWAEGGAEYLRIGDGTTIRLDRLTEARRAG